jgi:thiol-disulfide isomerase/thioredoxin
MRDLVRSLPPWFFLLLAVACNNDRGHDEPAPASAPSFLVVERKVTEGDLATILASESNKAKDQKLKPYVEFRADWCGPCKSLERSMTDARMKDAFAGVYLVRLDADDWGPKLKGTGFDASTIPVFFEVTETGKPTGRRIDGGAWGDNIPENMAPPLRAFFHP